MLVVAKYWKIEETYREYAFQLIYYFKFITNFYLLF